jgi:hypothetical protein
MDEANNDEILQTKFFDLSNQKDLFAPLCVRTQQKADLLMLNEDFQNYVNEMRISFQIPIGKDGFLLADHGMALAWWREVQQPRFSEWDKSISTLLTRCNLLSGWREAIEWYVICAREGVKLHAPYSMMVTDGHDKFGNAELKIVVNDYSAEDDIKYIHKLLIVWRTHLGFQKPRQSAKPIPRFEYYVRMLELKKKNYTDSQISEELNQEFGNCTAIAFTSKIVHDDLVNISKKIASLMS